MEDVAALGVLKVSRCVHLRRLNALFETFCPSLRARSVLAEQKKNDLIERTNGIILNNQTAAVKF